MYIRRPLYYLFINIVLINLSFIYFSKFVRPNIGPHEASMKPKLPFIAYRWNFAGFLKVNSSRRFLRYSLLSCLRSHSVSVLVVLILPSYV
ncbi:hypothetical protein VNO77_03410 [Canavalia gladiata]|uniref:Uncharacterized protein n=1 Tax=Canavalia gladiata TaxID=3824 RepID=A0AAN9R6U7_CANGL